MSQPRPRLDIQPRLEVRHLGLQEYNNVWEKMRNFTARRDSTTCDELWLVQHPPVFTLGTNGKEHHILNAGDIPVTRTDRGGQVTYHGPGQLIAYLLIDLKRSNRGVRQLVTAMEQSIIDLLAEYQIKGETRRDAPGVYVARAKIAALGLRVRRGCSYHGLSLNVDMDLTPFRRINPCGYERMKVTSLLDIGINISIEELELTLPRYLIHNLQYSEELSKNRAKHYD